MEDKTIYLSGPISDGGKCTEEEKYQHVLKGIYLKHQLMSKGYAVYCPQLSVFAEKQWAKDGLENFSHDGWLTADKQWVRKAKYFFYMEPEIYGNSKGARMELELAKQLGKRIFTRIDDVPSKHEILI